MRAVVFRAPFEVRLEQVADAVLEAPTDVVVEVDLAAICGSDLHPYRGKEKGLDPGTVMGHEFVGTIAEVGDRVVKFEPGDRVVAPFSTCCGDCVFCTQGLTARCERGQLFGWVEEGRGLQGGQAERVRVPLADATLAGVPEGVTSDAAIFAGDILATGLFATDLAGVGPGSSVAILGCGPVGLMAVMACRHREATTILAVDPVPERRQLARDLGARALDPAECTGAVAERTGGLGVEAVLEVVGSSEATRLAFDLVRLGGTIAAAGVHTEEHFAFSPGDAYDKNLTYRAGRCSVRAYLDEALEIARSQGPELAGIVTDRVPLEGAVDAYRRFDQREAGCIKVLLLPES